MTWAMCAGSVAALLVAARVFPCPRRWGPSPSGSILRTSGRSTPSPGPRAAELLQSAVWHQTAVPVLVLALLAVAVGTSVRNRRLHVAAFVDAANALARDQEQRERLAQAGERAHRPGDARRRRPQPLGHDRARWRRLGRDRLGPERSRGALDELVATGRSALGDMRRVLGVLHDGAGGPTVAIDAAPAGSDAPLEPQPGTPTWPRWSNASARPTSRCGPQVWRTAGSTSSTRACSSPSTGSSRSP
ncbi:hypothetical protein NKG05_14990 [Oerskovia sp. M15]